MCAPGLWSLHSLPPCSWASQGRLSEPLPGDGHLLGWRSGRGCEPSALASGGILDWQEVALQDTGSSDFGEKGRGWGSWVGLNKRLRQGPHPPWPQMGGSQRSGTFRDSLWVTGAHSRLPVIALARVNAVRYLLLPPPPPPLNGSVGQDSGSGLPASACSGANNPFNCPSPLGHGPPAARAHAHERKGPG